MRHGIITTLKDAFLTQPRVVCRYTTVASLPLNPEWVRKAAHVQRLAELGPREVREITPSTITSRRALWGALRHALRTGCILWILPIGDRATWDALEAVLPGLLIQLGPRVRDDDDVAHQQSSEFNGTAAYGFQTASIARYLLAEFPEQSTALRGIDAARVPADILERLAELSVPIYERPRIKRLFGNPRLYVYLVIFAYSAVRALPLVFVREFHGSILVLWSIDMLTALPYTWGVLAMATGSSRRTRITGALVTIGTFIAPYVYFWYHGRGYPPHVLGVVTLMILSGIALEVWKFWQEKDLERRYSAF